MVVYNVPARTVTDIGAETMCRLAEIPSVVAIKDASGDLARVTIHRAGAGADFCQLSGNDDLWLPHAVMGGAGRSEEHTSELQSLMRISYAVFCLQQHSNTPTLYSNDTTDLRYTQTRNNDTL